MSPGRCRDRVQAESPDQPTDAGGDSEAAPFKTEVYWYAMGKACCGAQPGGRTFALWLNFRWLCAYLFGERLRMWRRATTFEDWLDAYDFPKYIAESLQSLKKHANESAEALNEVEAAFSAQDWSLCVPGQVLFLPTICT